MRNEKVVLEVNNPHFILKPTPMSMEAPLRGEEDIETHRRLYCGHYSNCLDVSVREAWPGFTCMHCPLRDLASHGPGSEPFARGRGNSANE